MGSGLRYFGGAVAFGFAAVWIMASLAAALVCLLSAAVGYGAVFVAERTRSKLALRAGASGLSTPSMLPNGAPEVEDMSLRADELNHDLGHVYEPTATMPPLPTEGEYGWPPDSANTSETPR